MVVRQKISGVPFPWPQICIVLIIFVRSKQAFPVLMLCKECKECKECLGLEAVRLMCPS